jgi:hypothetical protein
VYEVVCEEKRIIDRIDAPSYLYVVKQQHFSHVIRFDSVELAVNWGEQISCTPVLPKYLRVTLADACMTKALLGHDCCDSDSL